MKRNFKDIIGVVSSIILLSVIELLPQAGKLDSTFGQGGIVTTAINVTGGNEAVYPNSMALQVDGKIVVAGYSDFRGDNVIVVVRYTTSGELDDTFGTNGIVITSIGSSSSATSLAIQDDGKILITGYSLLENNVVFVLVRYNIDGTRDYTFGIDGIVTTFTGYSKSRALSVALQSNGKIVVAGYANTGENEDFILARYYSNGFLDDTFGNEGIVTTALGTWDERINDVAIQSDGKIIAAGYSYQTQSGYDFATVRYYPNGVLDNTFGSDGILTTDISSRDQAVSLLIRDDEKFMLAGFSDKGNNKDAAILCYNSDGSPDSAFGLDGVVTTDIGTEDNQIYALTIQDDGKIVAAGETWNGNNDDFVLIRYTGSGVLDNTFGVNGIVTTDTGMKVTNIAKSVTIQNNGKVIVSGTAYNQDNYDFALCRYESNGNLDDSFGTDGLNLTTEIGTAKNVALSVAIQSDKKIIAAGASYQNDNEDDFTLVRYNPNGDLDDSFGDNGVVTTDINNSDDDIPYAVLVQDDGKILAAGYSYNGNDYDFALARYNSNGTLDNAFGNNGVVSTNIGVASDERGHAAQIQNDGKIVVAGIYENPDDNYDFAVIRYLSNGIPDNTFGNNGIVTTQIGEGDDNAQSLTIQPDGRIVVAGISYNGSNNDFALVRYNQNGSLDNTFGGNGIVTTQAGNSNDGAYSIALQKDGRIIAAGASYNNEIDADLTLIRYGTDGNLDATFGINGIVSTKIGNSDEAAFSISLQDIPNNKIIAAGFFHNGKDADFAVVRFNSNGSLDSTFGDDGIVAHSVSTWRDAIYATAVQEDGKIVAAGYSDNGNDYLVFSLARYTSDPPAVVINKADNNLPVSPILYQNYPNPFNPVTHIDFFIPHPTMVELKIFNILGQEVEILLNRRMEAGQYSIKLSAENYPSGLYFYTLKGNDFSDTKKFILLK